MQDPRAAQLAIETALIRMPFKVEIARRRPSQSGFEFMETHRSGGLIGVWYDWVGSSASITRVQLAYDAADHWALEILAHEVGHLLTWIADPELLVLHELNTKDLLKSTSRAGRFLVREAEEQAWARAESLLRRLMGRSFAHERFMRIKRISLDTYPKG